MADLSPTSLARAILPVRARRLLRRAAREAPNRLRDLPRDLVSAVAPRAFGGPIPPPGLRARVGLGSRAEFELVGREGARQILQAVASAGIPALPDWLDFGCGCGRLARYLLETGDARSYTGVDVDADQIAWAARNLSGRFSVMRPDPPLDFPDASFDVVMAISIFTHFNEDEQLAWLAETRRLLRPGGLLVATTHAEELARGHPTLRETDFRALADRGFLFVDAERFNDRSSFHRPDYLSKTWGPRLQLRRFLPRGFVGFQDLSVWERVA